MMRNIIEKYLNGEASAEEKQELLKLLGESPEARSIFLDLRAERLEHNSALNAEEVEAALERFDRSLDGQKDSKSALRPLLRMAMQVAAALALLLLTALGGYYLGKNTRPSESPTPPLIMHCFAMGSESKGSITLPDGTVAWLNADSRLTYPEEFEADNRIVKLEGEGYFDVQPDQARPFVVETGGMRVKALGTAFDLRNYAGSENLSLVLLNGSVEALFDGHDKAVRLRPNQSLVYNKRYAKYEVASVNAADYVIWIQNKLLLDDEKLSVILYKMERWYGIDIDAAADVPKNMRLSLTIRKESKEDIFRILEMIAPVSFSGEGDSIRVKGRRGKQGSLIKKMYEYEMNE
ncbi:MAG: FecR family protein [Tannerellaceae bacterium]|jgi:ferric-dicitrate binding protein FerR (iron transport regulator)|nr:FecR family protein [Tannerellaceae bacterium]